MNDKKMKKQLNQSSQKFLILLFFWGFILQSCDPVTYFLLKTEDDRFSMRTEKKLKKLTFESEDIQLEIFSSVIGRSPRKDGRLRETHAIGFDISFTSPYAIQFEASKSYVVDSSGTRVHIEPVSVFREDNRYKPNKRHNIGISFHFQPKQEYIKLPVKLYLPPFILSNNDTLKMPVIEAY